MGKKLTNTISTFENYCNCGGFAWSLNGRDPASPHMNWCPQYDEYQKWWNNGGKEWLEKQRNVS